jgi:23S rRNA G2069 N7-methylase RlmK/C1962 C5-methylase RlmI
LVVKQPFIEITEITNVESVKEFLDKNGFLLKKNNDYFSPDLGLILEDLHDENVLTNNGVPFFIDTVFYLDTSFFNK